MKNSAWIVACMAASVVPAFAQDADPTPPPPKDAKVVDVVYNPQLKPYLGNPAEDINIIETVYEWEHPGEATIGPMFIECAASVCEQKCYKKDHESHPTCNTPSCDIHAGVKDPVVFVVDEKNELQVKLAVSQSLSKENGWKTYGSFELGWEPGKKGHFGAGLTGGHSREGKVTETTDESTAIDMIVASSKNVTVPVHACNPCSPPCSAKAVPAGIDLTIRVEFAEVYRQSVISFLKTGKTRHCAPVRTLRGKVYPKAIPKQGPLKLIPGPSCCTEIPPSTVQPTSQPVKPPEVVPPGDSVPASSRKNCTERYRNSVKDIEPLLSHADEFGMTKAVVHLNPKAKTITVLTRSSRPDEFKEARSAVVVVGPVDGKPRDRDAIAIKERPDDAVQFTVDTSELAGQGISGLLTTLFDASASGDSKTEPTFLYLETRKPSASPGFAEKPGIAQLRNPRDLGAPVLMTNAAGRTPVIAVDGVVGDSTLALGEKTKDGYAPVAMFETTSTIIQHDEAGGIVAQTSLGTFQAGSEGLAALDPTTAIVGVLTTNGTSFEPGSIRPINDVIKGGLPAASYGKLTPVIQTPGSVEKDQEFEVRAILPDEAIKNYSIANRYPQSFVNENLEIVLFRDDKEIKSGIREVTSQEKASSPNCSASA